MSVSCDFEETVWSPQSCVTNKCDVNKVENMDFRNTVTGIMCTPKTPSGNTAGIGRGSSWLA